MDPIKKGLLLFEKGKYKEAELSFTNSIKFGYQELRCGKNEWRSKLGLLLDSRAACHEKLGDLRSALEDARQQIELEPYKCKSYLRAAKIHVLDGREYEALSVLESGIKRLKHGKSKYGDRLKINERLYEKMIAEASSLKEKQPTKRRKLKSTDPLKYLPFELVSTILSLVDQPTLLNCFLVNHQWYETVGNTLGILNSPRIKKHLSLKEFVKFLNFYRSRKRHRFKALDLSLRATEETSMVKQLLASGFRTEKLTLSLGKYDNYELSKSLKNITAGRHMFHDLKELSISMPVIENGGGLTELLQYLNSNIDKLNIVITDLNISKLVRLDTTNITFTQMSNFALVIRPQLSEKLNKRVTQNLLSNATFENVITLQLINCEVEPENLQNLLRRSRRLESLTIDSCGVTTLGEILRGLESTKSTLKSLHVKESSKSRPVTSISQLNLHSISRLRTLSLENTSLNFHQLMLVLCSTNKHLRHLRLKANYKVVFARSAFDRRLPDTATRAFQFREFLEAVPQLESLSLVQGTNLTDSALRNFSSELISTSQPIGLKILDLSMNEISGVGIIDLFQRPKSWLRLDQLIANGCDMHPDTSNFLLRREYCRYIQSIDR
ncbi:hypothetical protein OGAPHI_002326 [Ogataea philodendri]|uniref:F-box domain-containing protein n=1 Tax=Ogataea philodendri TaxID=1378263 RepID=A0A9P8PB14_9ASCO|nr:uncharacterized protein OGAPHI_002326 [Ogataea philodendri]KAH3668572.1 hypothetical protein OGAPHI_002326 [Ogataea philodendri]